MKARTIFFILIIFSISISCLAQGEYGQFTEAECPIKISEELASSGNFTFGYMTVPEFHKNPEGKPIELAVAIFKCRAEEAKYDPLILNSGGPGMSNLEDFVPTFDGPLGNLFLFDRDVVIIELRGLKHSKPNLHTPELAELQVELLGKHLSSEELINAYTEVISTIRKKFSDQGINLSAYNYWETANDIAFVMEKLGYEKFAAFGNSAGTFVAQYLLMDHADKLSALSLNAIANVPPGFNKMCVTSVNKLESIFEEIEQNETYAKAYPDLKKRFLSTLEALNESPDTITVQLPGEDGPTDVVLNGNRVTGWLFTQMYWNTQLPLTMHLIASRDYSQIIENPGGFLPLSNFSHGLFWSILLNGWPDPSEEELLTGTEYEIFVEGMSTLIFSQPFVMKMRDAWQVDYQPDHIKPMATNVPTLMMNGGEDHVCLPGYALELSDSFENSYCYIFEGIAHSPIDAGECAIMMMKQFLDNPQAAPDASCVEEYKKKPEYILP
jgi:pimeloyl-ACP methyl ester carboxylesterase